MVLSHTFGRYHTVEVFVDLPFLSSESVHYL